MAQNALIALGARILRATGALGGFNPLYVSPAGELYTSNGGSDWTQVSSIGAIVNQNASPLAGAGKITKLSKIIVLAPGTGGAFSLNDAATQQQAAPGNLVYTSLFNGSNWFAGSILTPEIQLDRGIFVSSFPTGGALVNLLWM